MIQVNRDGLDNPLRAFKDGITEKVTFDLTAEK